MLKPTECRLGNIVSYLGKEYKIECIHPNIPSIEDYGFVTWNRLQGVPITEEWLLSVGFKKYNGDFWDKRSSYKKNGFYLDSKFQPTDEDFNFELTKYRIQFIHQLQNIYFAHTEEELC